MNGSAILNNRSVSLFIILIVCLSIFIFSSKSFANSSGQAPLQDEHNVKVTLQLTDFIVRDSAGKFVSGLTADDFRIMVDGQNREISFLDESAGSLSVVLFFDQFNLGPKALADAKNLAKEIVTGVLSEDDRIAVVHFDGILQTKLGWSSDKKSILNAINQVKTSTANRYYYPPMIEVSAPMYGEYRRGKDWDFSRADEHKLKDLFIEKSRDLTNYIFSLTSLADALRDVRGRKTCIMFSEGPNTYETAFRMEEDLRMRSDSHFDYQGFASSARSNRRLSDLNRKIGFITIKDAEVRQELAELGKLFDGGSTTLTVIRPGKVDPEWKSATEETVKKTISPHVYRLGRVPLKFKRMQDDRDDFLRTLSRLSNGRFFDAGIDRQTLMAELQQETRNYYVAGFEPPQASEVTYHTVSVKSGNPGLSLINRKGYFSKHLFKNMTPEERQIHLEEDLNAPGINNDLDLTVITSPWLPSGNPTILLSAEIDREILGLNDNGNHELEMAINLIDSENRLRFREHRRFTATSGTLEGNAIWFKKVVPRSKDKCIAYISIRDNVTGKKSTWNKVLEPIADADASPKFHGTMMLKPHVPGDLNLWQAHVIEDNQTVEESLTVPSLQISGRPILDYKIEQGSEVVFFCTIGNLPESFDPAAAQIGTFFILDPESDTKYQLSASELNIRYLAERKEVMISSRVPLGLAQRDNGQLAVVVAGISEGSPYIVFMPYQLTGFSSERAVEYLKDPRIKPY